MVEIIGVTFAVMGVILSAFGIIWRLLDSQCRKNRAELILCVLGAALLWQVFIYLLIIMGWIRAVPNLYNKGIPFYYLIAPGAYFYTFFKLFPNKPWPKYAWLHLVPFMGGLIDIIPYAIASTEEKRHLVNAVVENMQMGYSHSYGFIEQKWHYILKFMLAFVYLMAQWRLLYIYDMEIAKTPRYVMRNMFFFAAVYSLQLLLKGSVVLSLLFNELQQSHIMRDMEQLVWVSFFYFLFSIWLLVGLAYERLAVTSKRKNTIYHNG